MKKINIEEKFTPSSKRWITSLATPLCVYGQNVLATIFGVELKDWTPLIQACQLSMYPLLLRTIGCES